MNRRRSDGPAAAADEERAPELECAFYTVADEKFFVGAVALLNSLRLAGHDERVFLVDCGLTAAQRERLADHVTLVPAPEAESPVFLSPFGPTAHPARVAVVLDADLIVLRPLTELIETARSGRIVAFWEPPPTDFRSFASWSSTLDLPAVRAQAYVNAGQLFFPYALGRRLLRSWSDSLAKVPATATRHGGKVRLDDPFYFADQDVLNAVLATRFEPEELELVDYRYAPHAPFDGLTVVDEMRRVCRYADGEQPFLLHHILAKPWFEATRTTPYSQLLPRVLLAPDVAVRLEPVELPLRLRPGRLAAVDRRRVDIQTRVRAEVRRQAGRFGIRTRIRSWRRRRQAGRAG